MEIIEKVRKTLVKQRRPAGRHWRARTGINIKPSKNYGFRASSVRNSRNSLAKNQNRVYILIRGKDLGFRGLGFRV